MNVPTSLNAHGLVRVAACTPELWLGDVSANVAEIAKVAHEMGGQGVQIGVFPELCITGYSCGDAFMNAEFRACAVDGLRTLADKTSSLPILLIVGLPFTIDDRLYNMAAVLHQGAILGLVPKSYLPNSWEFYERRWFSPASTLRTQEVMINEEAVLAGSHLLFEAVNLPLCRVAVEICEDLWAVIPPSSHASMHGATIVANLSASDELLGKADYRRQLVAQQSGRCLGAYVYSSSGPGESTTDLVFSGHSMIAENGSILNEAERFRFSTQIVVADIDLQRLHNDRLHNSCFRDKPEDHEDWQRVPFELHGSPAVASRADLRRSISELPFVPAKEVDREAVCQEIFAIQATALARRIRATKARTLVIGLSGGLDSTLALLVAQEALERGGVEESAILAVTMPGPGTSDRTKDNATILAAALEVELRTLPISEAVALHLADLQHKGSHDITFENAQARERTQILMDLANQTGGLVVGTGDLSEAALGWCTFNGDHMSMYHVNTGIPKTLVKYLIEWCSGLERFSKAKSVLCDILATPISPELIPAAGTDGSHWQKTEDNVGPYKLVDFFLYYLVRHGFGREKIAFLARLVFENEYTASEIDFWLDKFLQRFRTQQFKRSSMPDGPKVGTVALSPRGDWRMPSDLAKFI